MTSLRGCMQARWWWWFGAEAVCSAGGPTDGRYVSLPRLTALLSRPLESPAGRVQGPPC